MPAWFNSLTTGQWWAAGRNYISFGLGILATLGIVTVVQSHDALGAIDQITAGLKQVAGGVTTLAGIIGTAIAAWKAAHNAAPAQQIKSVAAIANDPTQPASTDAKAALLTAAVSVPEVKHIEIAAVDTTQAAKADVSALNAATPPAVVMSSVPQTVSKAV